MFSNYLDDDNDCDDDNDSKYIMKVIRMWCCEMMYKRTFSDQQKNLDLIRDLNV